jgi:lysophospholipase L1-like esterase
MNATGARRLLAVYGDSLAMPRVTDRLDYVETYPEAFRAGLETARGAPVDLYNRSRGGATIRTLFGEWANDATYFGPAPTGITVIQGGIVDCAPRPTPRIVRHGVGALPGPVRRRAIRFLHDHRAELLRAGLVWRVTQPTAFSAVLRRWLREASVQVSGLYVLTIAPTTEAMNAHSPGLGDSIERYNELIADAVRSVALPHVQLVDVHAAILALPGGVERYINPSDGHHITREGHALYAQMLLEQELGRNGD